MKDEERRRSDSRTSRVEVYFNSTLLGVLAEDTANKIVSTIETHAPHSGTVYCICSMSLYMPTRLVFKHGTSADVEIIGRLDPAYSPGGHIAFEKDELLFTVEIYASPF